MIPLTEPWAPLLEHAEVVERAGAVRVCLERTAKVTVPLAVPPPIVATVEVTLPKGCSEGFVDSEGLTLSQTGATLVSTVTMDGRKRTLPAMAAGPMLGLGFGKITARPPELEGSHLAEAVLFTGSAAPFATLDDRSDEYFQFIHHIGLTALDLLERTGQTEMVNVAMAAMGPTDMDVRSKRLAGAVMAVDPDRLTPMHRRMWSYLADRVDTTPDPGPFLGTATLVAIPEVRWLRVGGQVLVDRDALGKATQEFQVRVPDGRAVLAEVATSRLATSACCGGFSWQTSDSYMAWIVLAPGGRYEVRSNAAIAPVGRDAVAPCISVGEVPAGARVSTARSVTATVSARVEGRDWRHWHVWERTEVAGFEPGDYVVDFPDQGAPRVRFTPGTCVYTPPPPKHAR